MSEEVQKLMEAMEEKDVKRLTEAMQALEEFSKFGASALEETFNNATNTAAFAMPYETFVASLQSSEFTADTIKDILSILSDPEFKTVLELLAWGIGQFVKLAVGIAKTFSGLWIIIIELWRLLTGEYKGAKIPVEDVSTSIVRTTGPLWWLRWVVEVFFG